VTSSASNELRERDRDEISSDLAAFTDPGTTVDWVNEKEIKGSVARWEMQGRRRNARFLYGPRGGLFVATKGTEKLQTYGQFLAGPAMADLRLLAQITLQAQGGSTRRPVFVPPQATWTDPPRHVTSAMTLLDEAINQDGEQDDGGSATNVLFLTADAGVGKTSLLRAAVLRQAQQYLSGRVTRVMLYVDAQGKALARLDDALAVSLQDLRSKFTYHTLASLVRLGLVVPVVDGFDELIGRKGGTDDAFQSLSGFLDRLSGHGMIVASARDVYYEGEFTTRADADTRLHSWHVKSLALQPWRVTEIKQYVTLVAARDKRSNIAQALLLDLEDLFASAEAADLRGKPFFIAHALELLLSGERVIPRRDFLASLTDAYLSREASAKLLLPSGEQILTSEQLAALFVELALEMWRQETRELDAASVREVVGLFGAASAGLDGEALRILTERAPTLALLGRGTRSGSVIFEHEILYSLFLANALAERLMASAHLLSRGSLPIEAARRLAQQVGSNVESPQAILDLLSKASRGDTPGQAQIRDNAGLVAVMLLDCVGERRRGLIVRDVVIGDAPLGHLRLDGVTFERVIFLRTDLSAAVWTNCRAPGCAFNEVLVSPIPPNATRLDITASDPQPTFAGLRVVAGEAIELVYDAPRLNKVLGEIGVLPREPVGATRGAAPPAEAVQEKVQTLEELAYAFRRGTVLAEDEPHLQAAKSAKCWPEIRKVLVEAELLTIEARAASGPRKDFYRRHFRAQDLLEALRGSSDNPMIVSVLGRLGITSVT
jgi:hypothetical protein